MSVVFFSSNSTREEENRHLNLLMAQGQQQEACRKLIITIG
jgi:hypothetical protein